MLAGHLHIGLYLREAQRFAAVVFAKVDGLGDVGVGFRPVLADFENQPGAELEFAFAQQIGNVEQQAGTLFDRSAAPVLERR